MDKIRVKSLRQGFYKHKDGSYDIGLVTIWGVIWVGKSSLVRFKLQNPHLIDLFCYRYLESKDLIGRYIYVTNKAQVLILRDRITTAPIL